MEITGIWGTLGALGILFLIAWVLSAIIGGITDRQKKEQKNESKKD